MANTITKTTLLNGPRNLVVLVNVLGDGSGEETNLLLIDRSSYVNDGDDAGVAVAVDKIEGNLGGFAATLSFDATTDLPFASLPNGYPFCYEWEKVGGVNSGLSGAGANGDILLTTSGLGAGERGTFTLFMRKA